MTSTETKIEVGAVFGYRKVVEVTTRDVRYINLNGRKNKAGRKVVKDLPIRTAPISKFRRMVKAA